MGIKRIDVIKEIHEVISFQASSLREAREGIGSSYLGAIETIYRCKGKIIVTGVGKSGVIAQKIASTFASTGTPAIYLHPSEALHGNLGIVQKTDVILALGKSGESDEINILIPSLKKIGVKIIAMTSNPNSTMARRSDIVLHLAVNKEACPLNLAPTTSSMVSLVIGDALAIVLMKLRGFKPEHFALFHPGGILGKRLTLKVSDIMRSGNRNPVVSIKASMRQLLEEISRKWTGAASVVGPNQKFMGLVTDYDIRNVLLSGASIKDIAIKNVMNATPLTIREDELASRAAEIMEFRKKPLTVLPVVDKKHRAVGMIHTHDLMNLGFIEKPSDLN